LVSSSARVVYAGLAGDLAVAAAKFGASSLSGWTAMLTEGIHSSIAMWSKTRPHKSNQRVVSQCSAARSRPMRVPD